VWAPVLGGGLGVDPGGGLEWCSAAAFRGVRAAHWPHEETFQLHFHILLSFILDLFSSFHFPSGGMKMKKMK